MDGKVLSSLFTLIHVYSNVTHPFPPLSLPRHVYRYYPRGYPHFAESKAATLCPIISLFFLYEISHIMRTCLSSVLWILADHPYRRLPPVLLHIAVPTKSFNYPTGSRRIATYIKKYPTPLFWCTHLPFSAQYPLLVSSCLSLGLLPWKYHFFAPVF